jgi:hypothetical protein
MAETKPKQASSLREPQTKKKLGLAVPPALRLPHADLIKQEAPTKPSQSSLPSQSSQSSHTGQTKRIAPEKDFAKVPNSLAREVIPAKEFKGKSKQLYDSLYAMTRGSITPKMSIRATRARLMKLAGIGSRVTFESHVAHLSAVGLLRVVPIAGEHEGNEYTVFLPEERTMTSQTSHSSQTSPTQDQDGLVSPENSLTSQSLIIDSQDTSGASKTSFKTKDKNTDDEAAPARLRELEKELTGKNSGNAAQWNELFDVLAAELRIAAGRTTVSSVPAFLAEHLRRRLWKLDKKQAQAEGRELPDQVATVESSKPRPDCPDCGGSGWWYPDGPERGVMKCTHKNALQTN